MKKIIWQARTSVIQESFLQSRLLPGANGGNAYDFHALQVLQDKFDVSVCPAAILKPKESIWSYWHRMRKFKSDADVLIKEPYPLVFGNSNDRVPQIGMIHHIDDELARTTVKHQWFFRRLKKRLAGLDFVVTVSKYWENYLRNLGCREIRIIYNSFDPTLYRLHPGQGAAFRKKYHIPEDKILVYAGNATRQKGIYEVYAALKDQGYHLLMSGSQNKAGDLPVQYLHLDRENYLSMLHTCDLVITFSHMTEGWNRIAHESLLCGTPVIGSGVGGMRELLEGAGQTIAKRPEDLQEAVKRVLAQKEQLSVQGKKFVEQFDMNYFSNSWQSVIDQVLALRNPN